MKHIILCVGIVLAFVFSGCQSGAYKVSTSVDENDARPPIPYYEVSKYGHGETLFMKAGGKSFDGVLYDEVKMPVQIVAEKENYISEPGFSGITCFFTLGVLPLFTSEYMTQDITVKTPIGEKTGSYRVDAKCWFGWIPLFIGYPMIAEERDMEANLPNERIEKIGRSRLVDGLLKEFDFKDYVAFAKKKNAARKIELARMSASKAKIEELVKQKKFADAEALVVADSELREGSLVCDSEAWNALKKFIADQKEDCRVADKKLDLEKKFAESRFEDVVAACKEEVGGAERHVAIWDELKSKAEDAISERDRKKELARIETRKEMITRLFDEKKYVEVIAECAKETGANVGSRPEDSEIWAEFRNQAQAEKDKIDRAIEERRIAAKLESINKLLEEKKFSDVVTLCDEERGQNAGSRPEDMAQWKTIRVKALADDLLSKIDERSKSMFCLKGFYLGMSIEEVDVLLNYYFPSMSHSLNGTYVDIAGQAMHFCETASGRVTRINFNKTMLAKWFEYDAQSEEEWADKFSREYNMKLRSVYVRDSKSKGDASVSVSQVCYTYKNTRQNFRVTYFGEKDVSDYNRDPEEIENEVYAKVMSFGNDPAYSDIAYQIGYEGGYAAGCIKSVRKWLKNSYDNGKGAAEGTLRVESVAE